MFPGFCGCAFVGPENCAFIGLETVSRVFFCFREWIYDELLIGRPLPGLSLQPRPCKGREPRGPVARHPQPLDAPLHVTPPIPIPIPIPIPMRSPTLFSSCDPFLPSLYIPPPSLPSPPFLPLPLEPPSTCYIPSHFVSFLEKISQHLSQTIVVQGTKHLTNQSQPNQTDIFLAGSLPREKLHRTGLSRSSVFPPFKSFLWSTWFLFRYRYTVFRRTLN